MISYVSDLILGTGAALKAVMSFEAGSGSGSSVRNLPGAVGVGCRPPLFSPLFSAYGYRKRSKILKGGIARVEGCNSNPRGYRSWRLRCYGSCHYGIEGRLRVDAS